MPNITKRELAILTADRLSKRGHNFTQQEVTDVFQSLIEEITSSLAQGDTVVMRNFGTFEVRELGRKIGRNPRSPEIEVVIPPRAGVKFKPGKDLKTKVASGPPRIHGKNAEARRSA